MKKFLKVTGIVLLVLIVVAGISLAVIGSSDVPSYDKVNFEIEVESTPERLARGQVLVNTLCAQCHMDPETRKLTGNQMKDVPKEFGTIYSSNITQNKEYGIGDYTDAELVYLLRTGIKKSGQYSPPYMPKFPTLADEDLYSIIAYLKSDAAILTDDPTPDKECEPSLLNKILCRVAFGPFDMPTSVIELPDTTNQIEWGRYLAHNLDCFSCHSLDFKSVDYLTPEKSVGYFGGGNKTLNKKGEIIQTQNLTPDKETGIGNWSEEKFVKAVKYGQMEGEPALRYPMNPYVLMSDSEIVAIYHYLMTIPPIKNDVQRSGL